MLRAVVFDSDGTLLNTPEIILAAYRHVALKHGLTPPTREEIMRHMGKALHEIYQGLFPDHDSAPLVASNGEYIVAHRTKIEALHAGTAYAVPVALRWTLRGVRG